VKLHRRRRPIGPPAKEPGAGAVDRYVLEIRLGTTYADVVVPSK